VLAAGGGRRFGAAKQLASFRGRPLLSWPLAALRAAGVERRIVVLGADADAIAAAFDFEDAELVRAADWERGQSASLEAGLAAAGSAEAALILLADQPLVTAEAVRRVLARRGESPAVRATYGGRPGHPTLIARELWPRIARLSGDRGAGALLEQVGYLAVACDDVGSPADVDTPDDLRALERGN
jgi:CTP:molybdopterin cytidylyltransferase MocA